MAEKGFEWSPDDEPHAKRKREILAKYPEIKKLMGPCPRTKYVVMAAVTIQIAMAYNLRDAEWSRVFLFAYLVGATLNHLMTQAIHELAHNLGFKTNLYNQIFGIIASLPLGLPSSATFKRYHMDHHRYQGEDGIDVDIASSQEVFLFDGTFMKAVWCSLNALFYGLRPGLVFPKSASTAEILNWIAQISFNACIWYIGEEKAMAYLLLGLFFSMGWHPVGGHLIAEHFTFIPGQETYSYYGPLNMFTFNVGYHNEHHDFPNIPGSRLPQVRKIAPEYYDSLPHYHSWTKVIWDFVFLSSVGVHSRVKRNKVDDEVKEKLRTKTYKLL